MLAILECAGDGSSAALESETLMEESFIFARGNDALFGLLHKPASATRTGFVTCHPIAEEKLWSHRVFVSAARALSEAGHATLRFDFTGAGDSSGETSQSTLDTYLEDLSAAVAELDRRVPGLERIGLLGLRLGGSIAALLAERAVDDDRLVKLRAAPLVLWDPVLDGEAYFQELLRSNLSTQLAIYGKVRETREVLQERIRAGETVNVDGYEIGKPLFESCALPGLLSAGPKKHAGPALVVQIAANEKTPVRSDLAALAGAYRAGTSSRAIEHPFWREIKPFYGKAANLQRVTLEWLENAHV
jgi:alpha/beta superfamily hydrolase